MSEPAKHPRWLLRRTDQIALAVAIVVVLAAVACWWIAHGGHQGRLAEVERLESRIAKFQVDLNTASLPELMQLPGVGRTLAERIVESRQTAGPFNSNDELRRVRGIGEKRLEQILPYLAPLPSSDKTEN